MRFACAWTPICEGAPDVILGRAFARAAGRASVPSGRQRCLAEDHLVWWQSNGIATHKAAMAHAHGGGQSTTLNDRGTSSIRGYADHGASARDAVEGSVHDPAAKRLAGACASEADGRRLGGGRHHAEFFSAGHQPVSAGRMYGDTMGKVPSHGRYSPAQGPADKGGYVIGRTAQ